MKVFSEEILKKIGLNEDGLSSYDPDTNQVWEVPEIVKNCLVKNSRKTSETPAVYLEMGAGVETGNLVRDNDEVVFVKKGSLEVTAKDITKIISDGEVIYIPRAQNKGEHIKYKALKDTLAISYIGE